jgi:hypothetical protein
LIARNSIASDRLLDRQAILQATNPEACLVEIDVIAAQADRFADPQTVAVNHQPEQMVAGAMSVAFQRFEQPVHLSGGQEILSSLMCVSGLAVVTLDIMPVGCPPRHAGKLLIIRQAAYQTFNERHLL